MRGFSRSSVHTVSAATSRRRGADDAAGGPAWPHHRIRRCLSPRCPWRGDGSIAYCEWRRWSRGSVVFASRQWLVSVTPSPPAPRPPPGGQGSGMRYGLMRGFSRSSVHTVSAAISGRHGADDAAGGPAWPHHRIRRCVSPRCPWRETRIYGLPGQARRCVQERRGCTRGTRRAFLLRATALLAASLDCGRV